MTPNKIQAKCFQQVMTKGQPEFIGFEIGETTNDQYEFSSVKEWATINFDKWYALRAAAGQPVFKLNVPIRIEISWNKEQKTILTPKRISKNELKRLANLSVRKNIVDIAIQLKKGYYVLVAEKFIKALPPKHSSINSERVLNSIEYFNVGFHKYGSPILYTGITQ